MLRRQPVVGWSEELGGEEECTTLTFFVKQMTRSFGSIIVTKAGECGKSVHDSCSDTPTLSGRFGAGGELSVDKKRTEGEITGAHAVGGRASPRLIADRIDVEAGSRKQPPKDVRFSAD